MAANTTANTTANNENVVPSNAILRIAVVGHTNTGKTSLIRSILHDRTFGEVSARPSTTRDVVAAHLLVSGVPQLTLFDTPGLEDGIGLYEELEQLSRATTSELRHNEPEQIKQFLATQAAHTDFEQEAKVLRQLLTSDAALYVIDARDPVLPKHQDELAILRRCGKPILPILNFTAASNSKARAWQEALAQVNLHGWVEFDTVSLPEFGERELFTHLGALLPKGKAIFSTIVEEREQERRHQQQAARRITAELLMDVAAYTETVMEPAEHEQTIARMQQKVSRREQHCVEDLLALFGFDQNAVNLPEIAIKAGQWQQDLFAPETFKAFGIKAGKGIVAGGAAGASVDLMLGGMTLGTGTVVGVLAGGAWQTWQKYGRNVRHKIQGYYLVHIEESVIRLLAARCERLLAELNRRGHAAVEPLQLLDAEQKFHASEKFKTFLRLARENNEWSALSTGVFRDDIERQKCIKLISIE